ncbi:MAG: hypothetical protein WC477_06930 [Patescibacteria group bacterium]
MATSRKILAKISTYDPYDCTSTGYDVKLFADGRLVAKYHTRWHGDEDETQYERVIDVESVPDGGWQRWIQGIVANSEGKWNTPRDDEWSGARDGWKRIKSGHPVH